MFRLQISHLLNSSFKSSPFNGSWVSGTPHHDYDDDNLHLVADHELVVDDTKTGLTVLDVRTGVKTVLLTRSIMVGHVLGILCIVYCLLCYIYSVLFSLYHVLCTVYCVMYCVLFIM